MRSIARRKNSWLMMMSAMAGCRIGTCTYRGRFGLDARVAGVQVTWRSKSFWAQERKYILSTDAVAGSCAGASRSGERALLRETAVK